jgi:hypothetical protein
MAKVSDAKLAVAQREAKAAALASKTDGHDGATAYEVSEEKNVPE